MAITRRRLIVSGLAVGGGLAVVYASRRLDDGDATEKFGAQARGSHALNAWIRIAADGMITCGVHRAEMGQGVTTSLPMLLAEELDADWRQVTWEFTPLDKDYFNFGILLRGRPLGDTEGRFWATAGTALIREAFHQVGMTMTISSSSTVDAWDTLRTAGAAARAMLIAAAARRWTVPGARLTTTAGRVQDPVTGQTAAYGELAEAAARERPPRSPKRKDPAEFRLLGTSPPRLDIPAKVTGSARFGIDTNLPGMLYGAVRHSPVAGGRIARLDATAAAALPGVEKVVPLGDRAVAVLAGDTWTAMRAAERLVIEAVAGPKVQPDTPALLADYRKALDDPQPAVFRDDGDAGAVLAAGGPLEAIYELPFLAHVCMEPMNCAALFDAGRLTVWAPTQAPSIARDEAAKILGLAPDQVDVRQTLIGGGFGRRAEMDFVVEAALAAKASPGRPVKLTWSRAEDVRHDMYRPAAVGRVRGTLGDDGRITALDYTLVSESVVASNFSRTPTARGGNAAKDRSALSGALDTAYAIPNVRMAYVPRNDGMPVGFWRSVSNSINPFLLETFMDELASAARADPVEFRLRHLPDQPAARAVLEAAARLGNWEKPPPAGGGRGVAFIESHASLLGLVVEVTVAPAGELRVTHIACVVDCRTVVHPDNVVAQITGGILDGLNAALHGSITVRQGGVEQANFNDYPWRRLADAPPIAVQLLPQGGRPGGVGEPGVPGVAPALVNAIYAATGKRIRTLPIGTMLA